MAKAHKKTEGKAQQSPAVLFDSFELSIIHSTNVNDLNTAYREFLDLDAKLQALVLTEAGPARTVSLALRGYELPDFAARIASAKFLSSILTVVTRKELPDGLREQVGLILAQQRSVLLETIEQDLEALQSTELPHETANEWGEALTTLYTDIRAKSHQAIRQLFAASDLRGHLSLSEAM